MAIKTLGAALRQIDRLFADGAVTGLSDAQLLERFVGRGDTTSFEALVARHGPMVLSVCRGILRDPNDAEDAFQATFLILVKKAGSIGSRVVLGGWLYQVAHRVAIQANIAAARRRAREREAGQMTIASASSGPGAGDDLLPALHEEIARLPEKYRLPILLCDLEGLPQAQAAGQLRWSERTLRRRLAEARDRLKGRLARRGLTPDGAMLGAVFLREARAAVPSVLNERTIRAALDLVNHTITVGTVSAAAGSLTREVLKVMMLQKLKLATAALLGAGLMAGGAAATWISRGDEPQAPTSAPVARRATPPAEPRPVPEPDPLDAVGAFPVTGRVLDTDGKPVANAEIFVRHHNEFGWSPISPVPEGQKGRVTESDADGRFQFELDKASSDWPYDDEPPWHKAMIAATAPGFGLAWVEAGSLARGGEATLRLVRDDVPIHGRVVDTQGRPAAGVTVRLGRIRAIKDGVDPDAMLASGAVVDAQIAASYGSNDADWPGGRNTWTSDAGGRFEVRGLGRDRLGLLFFHGPGLADGSLYVMARPARPPAKSEAREKPSPGPMMPDTARARPLVPPLVGATFEHVAGPSKPIHGVVRSKGTGKPVAGVLVHGFESARTTSVSARTDADGRFLLTGLPKGRSYEVYAGARTGIDPFFGARILVTDTEGLKPIETSLELPRGVIVTGRLVDEATGRVVPAGACQYTKLPTNPNEEGDRRVIKPARLSLTDPAFRITVPPGEGMFYAAPRGRETPYLRARLREADKGKGVGGIGDSQTVEIPLQAFYGYKIVDVPDTAEPFAIELRLTRGARRRGRVVGPDGKPLIGAYCYGLLAAWGDGSDVKKLADDTFEVLGLEPDRPRQLIFAHRESGLVGSAIINAADVPDDAPIEVRLVRPGTVKGRLIDEDGFPLAGVKLSIVSFGLDVGGLPSDNLWPDGSTFTADADGRFQVTGLKSGTRSNIGLANRAAADFRLDSGGALFNLAVERPGEVRDLGDVRVKRVAE